MSKKADKSVAVKEAEAHGGETFDPTTVDKCPDCKGEGILSPTDTRVCQTCQGTGQAQ